MSFWLSTILVCMSAAHIHTNQCECEQAIRRHWQTGTSLAHMKANSDNLIISEIMQNPNAVADSVGEWFEVYNPGATVVNMNGWTIRDNGTDSHVISADVFVQPGGYAVLGINSNVTTNGGIAVDYQYSGFLLANGADEVVLVRPDASIANEVDYTGASPWPDPTGASMELSSAFVDNTIATNWAAATDVMASGDKGTPGTGPDAVPMVVITEIMQNPSAVADSAGEWFEVYNPGNYPVNMKNWVLKDAGSDSHTILSDVMVDPGGFAVLGINSDPVTNGGIVVTYQYSSFLLANSADEIIIQRADGSVVDEVWYTGTSPWPNPTGASMELNGVELDNNLGGNWSVSTTPLSNGDFATPGTGETGGGGTGGNQAPIIDAGVGRSAYFENGSAFLSLSGYAMDPDNDPMTYTWTLTQGTASDVTIQSPSSLGTSVTFLSLGSYTFELSVSDGTVNVVDQVGVQVIERPVYSGNYQIYFGNLHAHSAYSDGNKGNDPVYDNVAESFRYARDYGELDWLLMADHNHSGAGMALADYHSGVVETNQINAESGLFTAIYGMEWGTISGGGHVITASDSLWGWEAGNYDVLTPKSDYTTFFQTVNQAGGFSSLCHPNSSDFGNIFNSPYDAASDQAISMVAVKSGPAFSTATDFSDPSSSSYLSYYHFLLLKGYHVAPAADQDTHYANWGLANEQRTAVLAAENTQAAILEALSAGRCYAVEDRNIFLDYTATYNSQTYDMSSVISVPAGQNVEFSLSASDGDGETFATVEIFGGTVGGTDITSYGSATGPQYLYQLTPATEGTVYFFYMVATEADGQRAWSAPIWVETQAGTGPVNQTPNAQFGYLAQYLDVQFTDSSSDPDGTIASRDWNFGDGATSTLTNPSHSFATAGTYLVTLTVTDDQGASASQVQSVTVQDAPPVNQSPNAQFSFTVNYLDVQFTDSSSDPDGFIASFDWNFGDGATSNQADPSHSYAVAGTYSVTLIVTDDQGATASLIQSVTVQTAPPVNQTPTAQFSYTAQNLDVQFTDGSSDADGSIVSWNWNFGDGTTSSLASPSHTFQAAGTYSVTLTVTDDQGATNTQSQSVTVEDVVTGPVTETVSGNLSRRSSDYYQVTVAGGVIDLTCTFSGSRRDLDLYIYDDQGSLVAFTESTLVPETLQFDTQGIGGTYQIEVYNAGRRTTSYNLDITYQP